MTEELRRPGRSEFLRPGWLVDAGLKEGSHLELEAGEGRIGGEEVHL
jgi:hypothetical protein